jgi:hypothetical protein
MKQRTQHYDRITRFNAEKTYKLSGLVDTMFTGTPNPIAKVTLKILFMAAFLIKSIELSAEIDILQFQLTAKTVLDTFYISCNTFFISISVKSG